VFLTDKGIDVDAIAPQVESIHERFHTQLTP
jgi:hypothetical protein